MNQIKPVHGIAADAAVLDWQAMNDGCRLVRRSWPLAGARHGILLVHGLGEHSGRYAELARWFAGHGYDVRSYDQRGHGQSAGRRGALPRPYALLDDLAEIYAAYASDRAQLPLLLGHSMGGLVALRAVMQGRVDPPGLILSSPALRVWEPRWRQWLARQLARALPNLPLPSRLPTAALSHDAAVVEACQDDPLRHGCMTPRLGDFIIGAGYACIAEASGLAVPTLLLAAGQDHLVDPSGSTDFAAAAPARLTYRAFPGLSHELFNEAEPARRAVLAILEAWLSSRRRQA